MSGQLALTYTLRYQDQASNQASAALRTLERGLGGVQSAASGAGAAANAIDAQLASTGRTGRTAAAAAVAVERGLGGVQSAATGAGAAVRAVDTHLAGTATAGATAAGAVRQVERSLVGVERGAQATGAALQAVDQHLTTTGRAAADAAAGLDRVSASRAPAGLAATGRQADQTTESIRRMNREAGAGVRALQGLGTLTAGAAAARMAVQKPVGETMAYDRRLANVVNTAYAEESLDQRKARMRELDAGVMSAVRAGGGTRDGALDTYDRLVASGVKAPEAMQMLPTIVQFATGSTAEPSALADIAVKGRQTFGLTDMSRALDMSMKAGQLGGFELKDMAKWLPQQMAAGRMAGMKGEKDFVAMLVAAQAAAVTAGSKDEAGNNLVNLLAKINSQDTANDAKKLGVDSAGSLAAARAKGTGALDAFVNMVERVMQKDGRLKELSAKARSATGDDQRATFEAMADIMKGSAIGKLVQDRQALMALVGIIQQRYATENSTAQLREQVANAKGTGQAAFDLVAQTASFKAGMLAEEKANAMQQAMDKVNPTLGDLADKTVSLAREFPNLSAAVVAATTIINAIAAGTGVAAVAGRLLGWGGIGAGAGAAAAAAAGGSSAGAAGAAAAGAAGAGGAAAAAAGGGAAAAAMAALLSVGALVAGGSLGTTLYRMGRGTKLGDGFGDFALEVGAFFGSKKAQDDLAVIRQLEAAAVAQKAAADRLAELAAGANERPPLVVQLDGREIYSSVNDIATEAARRR